MNPRSETAIPANIKAGDVVTLLCGGPKMTAESIDTTGDGYIDVVWFDPSHPGVQRAKLKKNVLKLAE